MWTPSFHAAVPRRKIIYRPVGTPPLLLPSAFSYGGRVLPELAVIADRVSPLRRPWPVCAPRHRCKYRSPPPCKIKKRCPSDKNILFFRYIFYRCCPLLALPARRGSFKTDPRFLRSLQQSFLTNISPASTALPYARNIFNWRRTSPSSRSISLKDSSSRS